jgi:diacylglycerol kinase
MNVVMRKNRNIFEALNTTIEKICNLIDPCENIFIKQIKDVSASAILILNLILAAIFLSTIFYQ